MTGRLSIVFAGCRKVLLADGVPLMQYIMVNAWFGLRKDDCLDRKPLIGSV